MVKDTWNEHQKHLKMMKARLRYSITINSIWKDLKEGKFSEWELFNMLHIILTDKREPIIRLDNNYKKQLNMNLSPVIVFTNDYRLLIERLKSDGSIDDFNYYLDPLNLAISIKYILDYIAQGRTDKSNNAKMEDWLEKRKRGIDI